MYILIYRAGEVFTTVNIAEGSYVSRTLMGDDTAYIEFLSAGPVLIKPGDYAILCGHTYFVRDAVIPTRDVNRLKYQLTLYGTVNELEKAKYFIFDSTGIGLTAETSYSCTALEFITQLVANMSRIQPGVAWQVGAVDDAGTKTIELSNMNCLEALESAAELFELDYYVNEFVISLIKTPVAPDPLPLEVGMSKGLREITANKSGDSKVVTRLYAYGSATNDINGQRLTIDPLDVPDVAEIIEEIKYFDDIYPRVEATVTFVGHTTVDIIRTLPLGFDISAQLIVGFNPKLTFLSGELEGLEFRFEWDGDDTFHLIPYTLAPGVIVPGAEGYNPAIGDRFFISNINMPASSIAAAELELYNAAVAHLITASKQKVKLNITCDNKYFQLHTVSLALGQTLNIKSDIIPELLTGIDTNVLAYRQNIIKPYVFDNLVVGDVYFTRPFAERVKTVIKIQTFKVTEIGGGDKTYLHLQSTASDEWTVNHMLGKDPSVIITDGDGREREGAVTYSANKNSLRVNFAVPVIGYVICN